jgi:predicted amidophosphoribosyltransferase
VKGPLLMICAQCLATVDSAAVTCRRCGGALMQPVECSHCRNLNGPRSKYRDQCGHRLERDACPPVERLFSERKHVTVLFSNISRYRDIFTRLDPEEIREITSQLFEAIVKIISRYDGHVDRILWNSVKARLIGRQRELKQMENAALRLLRKEGTVLTVSGDAGTGKSRLIVEFKASDGTKCIRWLDGHAYTYNRGIPSLRCGRLSGGGASGAGSVAGVTGRTLTI